MHGTGRIQFQLLIRTIRAVNYQFTIHSLRSRNRLPAKKKKGFEASRFEIHARVLVEGIAAGITSAIHPSFLPWSTWTVRWSALHECVRPSSQPATRSRLPRCSSGSPRRPSGWPRRRPVTSRRRRRRRTTRGWRESRCCRAHLTSRTCNHLPITTAQLPLPMTGASA